MSMKVIWLKRKYPIKFFFRTKEGLALANWKFIIHYNKWNNKPLVKLHVLIQTPFLCFERNNGGTQIGNRRILWFVR